MRSAPPLISLTHPVPSPLTRHPPCSPPHSPPLTPLTLHVPPQLGQDGSHEAEAVIVLQNRTAGQHHRDAAPDVTQVRGGCERGQCALPDLPTTGEGLVHRPLQGEEGREGGP